MGFSTDDKRIPLAFSIAEERGLSYRFITDETDTDTHPNTVDIRMTCLNGRTFSVRGESLGGGKVRISRIDHIDVDFPVSTAHSSSSTTTAWASWPISPAASAKGM